MSQKKVTCPRCGRPCFEWQATKFEIRQVFPAPSGMHLAYADDDGEIYSTPAELYGLVKVTPVIRTGHQADFSCMYFSEREADSPEMVVMPLDYDCGEGGYEVCRETSNFIGAVPELVCPYSVAKISLDREANAKFFEAATKKGKF